MRIGCCFVLVLVVCVFFINGKIYQLYIHFINTLHADFGLPIQRPHIHLNITCVLLFDLHTVCAIDDRKKNIYDWNVTKRKNEKKKLQSQQQQWHPSFILKFGIEENVLCHFCRKNSYIYLVRACLC